MKQAPGSLSVYTVIFFNQTNFTAFNDIHYMPKVLGRPLLMNRFDYFSNLMSTNLNVKAYNDILGNCVLLIL